MTRFAVLPIRELASSKTRFSPGLDGGQRALLSRAMLLDTTEAMTRSKAFDVITILTPEPDLWAKETSSGIRVAGTTVPGLNESTGHYVRELSWAEGDTLSVVLPDLPASSDEDFLEVAKALSLNGSGVIVPDRHLTGTNVLAGRLPMTWTPMFGVNSFSNYLKCFVDKGISPLVLYRRGLMFDVDEMDDLVELRREGNLGARTLEFVTSQAL